MAPVLFIVTHECMLLHRLAWGWGANGQLGLGNTQNYATPTHVQTEGFGDRPGKGVVQVVAGFHLTVAVTEDRNVWTWGLDDRQGSLGLGEDVLDVWVPTQVCCSAVRY